MVESVLAFIDGYNIDTLCSDGSATSAEVEDASPSPSPEAASSRRKRAKRESDDGGEQPASTATPSYTTMLQRRKRAEVQMLREEVKELEMHMARLECARWGSQGTADRQSQEPAAQVNRIRDELLVGYREPGMVNAFAEQKGEGENEWLDAAVSQYHLRRSSELKNRHLKALVHKHSNLNTSILRMIKKSASHPVCISRFSLMCDEMLMINIREC